MNKRASQFTERAFLAGMLLFFFSPSLASDCAGGYFFNQEYYDPRREPNTRLYYKILIDAETAGQAPIWIPGDGAEPLPLNEAYLVFRDYLIAEGEDPEKIQVASIALGRCLTDDGYRLYVFSTKPVGLYAVLFNKKVVKATFLGTS